MEFKIWYNIQNMKSPERVIRQEANPEVRKSTQEIGSAFVRDLFSLNQAERSKLQASILKNRGAIRIMVHPYYVKQTHHPDVHAAKVREPDSRIDIVEKGFERILKAKKGAPVLLFEGHNQVSNTTREISPILKDSGNEIYIVPTHNNDPHPFFEGVSINDSWRNLIETLKELGVTKCVVGGMHLTLGDFGKEGCAGYTIEQLKNHFELQVSSLAHPLSRGDMSKPDSRPDDF